MVHTFDENMLKFKEAAKFWGNLIVNQDISHADMVIVLASEDEEINYYTVYFLKALKYEKNLDRIFILASHKKYEKFSLEYATAPFEFMLAAEDEINKLCMLYSIYRFSDQIIINTFKNTADADGMRLLGCCGLSKKDITAIAILKLERVPADQEPYKRTQTRKIQYKRIDWAKETEIKEFDERQYDTLQEYWEAGVAFLLEKEVIKKEDPVVLFGVSNVSMYIAQRLEGYRVAAIIDNNTMKAGETAGGIPIYSPEEYLGTFKKNVKIIISSIYYRAMCEQLYYLGYRLGEQVFVVCSRPYLLSVSEKSIQYVAKELTEGRRVYKKLREKFPKEHIFICPYPGTGDVYLTGLYLKKVMQNRGIHKYVLVVVSGNCEKVANMFELNTVYLKTSLTMCLLSYARLMGPENSDITILNDGMEQTMVPRLRGYHGIDFHTMFQKAVFGLNERITMPQFKKDSADSLFQKYGLKMGKTVLISPYANTVYDISKEVWEEVAGELKNLGYDVCTNVSSPKEKAINGTQGIFIPYLQIIDFLNKAGGFVALRSGLCDIVSSSTAQMVIFYPEGKTLLNSSSYDYFSLHKMGFGNKNITELEFKKCEERTLLDKVRAVFYG